MICSRAAVAALGMTLGCGPCEANDSFGSEFSHVVAGTAIASVATVVADHYGVEQRAWVGFWTSVGLGFVSEGIQVASNGSSQLRRAALDFGSNLLGAAFGAWVTDRYLLQPVVSKDVAGHYSIGLAMRLPF
jgi:hypothetical protein